MQGRHVNWCCACDHSKPKRTSPLEVEGLKKQLSEAYATMHFLTNRRAQHPSPQTDMELTRTNQLIQQLLDVLRPNQITPSEPQAKATQGTQTEEPQESKGTQAEGTQEEEEPTDDGTMESELDEKRQQLYDYYVGQDYTDEQLNRVESTILNMDEDQLDAALARAAERQEAPKVSERRYAQKMGEFRTKLRRRPRR